jgi:hypothetical protein
MNRKTSIELANDLEKSASSLSEILELISTYKRAITEDQKNTFPYWKTGQYHLLIGAAFAESKKEKKEHYNISMRFCEQAMKLDSKFNDSLNNGSKIWESVPLLGKDYVDAMGFWYTARCYYFKECLSIVGRIVNVRLMINNDPVIARIDELNPNWQGGGNFLSRLYVSDLNWVLVQDPAASGNPHAWNVYFQNQAKVMLAEIKRPF